ncbi:hypothetical protein GCM10007382_08590 [Salinibacterium xinjiangense]|nr:hypothetical protein GCM10007382_08590 [Salinibacterium xinjiangense]
MSQPQRCAAASACTAQPQIRGQGKVTDSEALFPVVATATTGSERKPLGLYSRATISIFSERYAERLDLMRLSRRVTPPGLPGWRRDDLRGPEGEIPPASGKAQPARGVPPALQPTQHHANCPGRFIAHLRFARGDMQRAFEGPCDCDAPGDAHSSRTLIDVSLIEAAETHRLSDASMLRCFDLGYLLPPR